MNRFARSGVYLLVAVVGVAAFAWPFWLPATGSATEAHGRDAWIWMLALGGIALSAMALDLRAGVLRSSQIALLGVLSALVGLLRLLDLPGGGNAMFFLVILVGAAYGARFGTLLGLCATAVSALVTGGIGPWLPFQMLGFAAMGATAGWAGLLTRRLPARAEVAALAVFGAFWGFLYGGLLNLWSWPLVRDGGSTSYDPALSAADNLGHYARFYMLTSFGWDLLGALANAALIVLTGAAVLAALRRHLPVQSVRFAPARLVSTDVSPGG